MIKQWFTFLAILYFISLWVFVRNIYNDTQEIKKDVSSIKFDIWAIAEEFNWVKCNP